MHIINIVPEMSSWINCKIKNTHKTRRSQLRTTWRRQATCYASYKFPSLNRRFLVYFTAMKVLDSLKKTLLCGRQDLCLEFLLKNKNLFPPFETLMKETIIIQVKARACSLIGKKEKGRQLPSSTHHLSTWTSCRPTVVYIHWKLQ